jgi:hypothetical protein
MGQGGDTFHSPLLIPLSPHRGSHLFLLVTLTVLTSRKFITSQNFLVLPTRRHRKSDGQEGRALRSPSRPHSALQEQVPPFQEALSHPHLPLPSHLPGRAVVSSTLAAAPRLHSRGPRELEARAPQDG